MAERNFNKVGVNLLFIFPGFRGGTVTYPRELLAAFAKRGQFKFEVYVQKGAFLPWIEHENIRYREFGPFPNTLLRVLFEQLILPVVVAGSGIKLLFSPGFVSPLVGPFRKVVTIHDMYYKKIPAQLRVWQRWYWRIFVPLSLWVCDRVITVSNTTAADVLRAYPRVQPKIRSIYLGSSPTHLASEVRETAAAYFLVIGNITPNKNIEVVVDALRLLVLREAAITLKVVGSDLYGLLENARRRTGMPLPIELCKSVDDVQLKRLYEGASCTVVASIYEGFGLPVLEAMANGCPVITSGCGALREIAGDAALYFSSDSADELADTVQRLLCDHPLRREFVKRGYINVQRFSWEKAGRETLKVFADVLPRSREFVQAKH